MEFVVLNTTLYSLYVNIRVVRTTALDKGQKRRQLSSENATVSFAACPVCGFPTYNLRSTPENNAQE